MTLDEILGYPQIKIDRHPPPTVLHKCGIYKPGYEYQPPKEANPRKRSTSTVDHTGLTATQRKILAVLKKATGPMDATKVAKLIKQGQGSASMNMAKMYKMGILHRLFVKSGKTRWFEYVTKS